MMSKNRLIIAAAGAGKTTYLIQQACSQPKKKILITTFTTENEQEIRDKIIKKNGAIPANITILTWFRFLLQHGVRPYQDAILEALHEKNIGFYYVEGRSGRIGTSGHYYYGEDKFEKYYFTDGYKIYSDKIAKFVCRCNEQSCGEVVSRIEEIFDAIYIDEVQDLAGYDLEIIKLLFSSACSVLLVGDPRQSTYATHYEQKYEKYSNGKIKQFIQNELGKRVTCEIDETTLTASHRNNEEICNFSSRLYRDMPVTKPCNCQACRGIDHEHCGVFLIRKSKVDEYLKKFHPMQLRWDARAKCNPNYPAMNMGESKGLSFERVLIFPTDPIRKFIKGAEKELQGSSKAKFYVAITRAYHSVGIVFEDRLVDSVKDIVLYDEI
ncbi:UvrD-helicase domain-containing protein [Desulfovibrio sp. OttesenSCG-928-A18]|nr:UvrD-helicase domain-containing protein [Desulfovibrio sp. OttesenSCG-928-A18]